VATGRKYVSALVSELPRVNGWSIARQGGDQAPDRTQRLLNHASWDTFAAMAVVRRFAVAGLDKAARRGGRRRGLVIGTIMRPGRKRPARPPPGSNGSTWGVLAGLPTGSTPCTCPSCGKASGTR
jgi:hypothetical protein